MSKNRKTQRGQGGAKSGKGSSFPVVPVVALFVGIGLALTFSNAFRNTSQPTHATLSPPPLASDLASPKTNQTGSVVVVGGTTPADSFPSDSETTEANRATEFLNRGTEFYQKGNYAEAVTNYAAAVALSPDDETTHFNLASALVRLGRGAEAKAEYIEALKKFPDYPEAHNNLGNLLASEDKLAEAAEHISTAIKLARRLPRLLWASG